MLPSSPECGRIRAQLGGAGTSVGANYEEADGTLTKKDFVNKVGISRKEAKETRYFLRIISRDAMHCVSTYLDAKQLSDDIKESEEIISILSTIINKSTGGRKS